MYVNCKVLGNRGNLYKIQRESKTQLYYFYCMNTLKTEIGCLNFLDKIVLKQLNEPIAAYRQKSVETFDSLSIYKIF